VAGLVAAVAILATTIVGELATLDRRSSPKAPRAFGGCHSSAPQLSVLMIGNSYTAQNDLPSTIAYVLCRSGMATNVRVERLLTGGGTLTGWAANGAAEQFGGHDVVVLQDQSEVPSFGEDNDAYLSTLDALGRLGRAAEVAKSRLVLFQTWGHRHGDEVNPEVSPDYEVMQLRLDDGYDDYLSTVRGAGADADLAPVGDAWWSLYRDDRKVFDRLYVTDGSHPSALGTYLAALVLARTITSRPLPAHPWTPPSLRRDAAVGQVQAAARAG